MKAVVILVALGVSGCAPKQSPTRSTAVSSEEQSLYRRLGGLDTLRLVVDEWMLEVTSDERVRDFFVDADIGHLKLRMVEKLCVSIGGPCLYRGRELIEVHGGLKLKLKDSHLQAFVVGLDAALKRVDVDKEVSAELREVVRGMAEEISVATGAKSDSDRDPKSDSDRDPKSDSDRDPKSDSDRDPKSDSDDPTSDSTVQNPVR